MPPQASGNVGNPPAGYYRYFIGDGTDNTSGVFYRKDSAGAVTPLVPASYTDQQARDAIGAMFTDSNSIDFTYNSAGHIESAVVRSPYLGLVTGGTRTYTATDIGGVYQRSNNGAAMTDTLPALTNADNGYAVVIQNLDAAATITFATASPQNGALFPNGAITYVLQPSCRQTFIWAGTQWLFGAGNANLTKSPAAAPVAGDFAVFADGIGRQLSARTLSPMTLDTAQTVSGIKRFADGTLLMSSSTATDAEPYSDANPPETLLVSAVPAAPAAPGAGFGVAYIDPADLVWSYKGASGAVSKMMTKAQSTTLANIWYDVTNYGVSISNTGAQNVAALQALVNAAGQGSTFFFPSTPANYPMVGTITISANYQTFCGAGQIASVLFVGNTTQDLFKLNDGVANITFRDMGFWATATATAGSVINAGTPAGSGNGQLDIYRVGFQTFGGSFFNAILLNGSNGGLVSNFEDCVINNFTNYGIGLIGNTSIPNTFSALTLTNVLMNGNINGSSGAVAGIYIQQAGAVQINSCDIIQCQINLLLAPITSSAQVVASVFAINTYFDSSYGSCVKIGGTQPVVRCKFTACSFTLAGNAVAGAAAFESTNTAANAPAGIDFIGCSFFNTFNNNGTTNGLLLNGIADIQVIDCRVAGWTIGVNVTPSAPAGTTRLALVGTTIGPTGAIKGNGTGLMLNAGATTYGMVQVVDCPFPLATPYGAANGVNIVDNSTVIAGGSKIIGNNPGLLNPGAANPAAQGPLAATTTYVTSPVYVPPNSLRVGSTLRFTIQATNAATINTTTILGKAGTAGTTADGTVVTLAAAAGTAAVGAAEIVVTMVVRSIGAAGVVVATAKWNSTGGFSAAVSGCAVLATATINTTAGVYFGVALTESAANIVTVQSSFSEVLSQ